MFIMFIGSSGVGKSTLINLLKKKNKSVMSMPSMTTRKMRKGEKQGQPFYFLTVEEFQHKIKANEFFEYELIHGDYYGVSKKIFNEAISKGKTLMKDMGVEGAINLAEMVKKETETINIFFVTKNKKILKKRLKARGEENFKIRLKRFAYEQGERYKYDFIILNNQRAVTLANLEEVLKNQNKFSNYVFTKPINKLNKKKIKNLSEEYKLGFMAGAIKVALQNGKIYILSGHEKFVASILAGVPICKKVVESKKVRRLTKHQINEWKHYLEAIKQELINNKKEK